MVTLAWLWLALGGLLTPALATWWGGDPITFRQDHHQVTLASTFPTLDAGTEHHPPEPHQASSNIMAALPAWLVMTVAMMGPSTSPAVSHVAVNSLSWRRRRAKVEFLTGYLGVWALAGVAFAWAHSYFTGALPYLLLLSGAWQLSRFKVRQLRECHRSTPLPATGWTAEWAATKFGLRYGGHCLASCWLLMLAAMAAPTRPLVWMFAATALITAEKLLERPRRALRSSAVALVLLGALAVAF